MRAGCRRLSPAHMLWEEVEGLRGGEDGEGIPSRTSVVSCGCKGQGQLLGIAAYVSRKWRGIRG